MLHCCDYTPANFAHSSLFPLSLSYTAISFSFTLSLFSLLQSIRSSKCRINQSVHRLALMSKSSVTLRPRPNQLTTGLRIQVSVCMSLSPSLFLSLYRCVCVLCFASSSVKHHKFSILQTAGDTQGNFIHTQSKRDTVHIAGYAVALSLVRFWERQVSLGAIK